jgi:Helix-turn-helix domain
MSDLQRLLTCRLVTRICIYHLTTKKKRHVDVSLLLFRAVTWRSPSGDLTNGRFASYMCLYLSQVVRPMKTPLTEYLDTDQVQKILGIRHDYLRLKIRKGKIPALKIGRQHFVHVKTLVGILSKRGYSKDQILDLITEEISA